MKNQSTPSIRPFTVVSGATMVCSTIPSFVRRLVGIHVPAVEHILATLFAVVCVLSWAAEPAAAQDKTFNKPRHLDDRLDWCLTWGTNCGKPAAVAFCNRRRFTGVVVFRAEVVGKSAPTRLIGSNQVCSGHDFCTAFAYITCTGPIEQDRVFANPVWKGDRLDVCLQWGTNCGKPAADAFCKTKGFSESLDATADLEPGYAATRLIGTDQVCDKPFCRGFQQIICK